MLLLLRWDFNTIPMAPAQKTNCSQWVCYILWKVVEFFQSVKFHPEKVDTGMHSASLWWRTFCRNLWSPTELTPHLRKHPKHLRVRVCMCVWVFKWTWVYMRCRGFLLSCQCHFLCNKLSECLMGPAGTVRRGWSAWEYLHILTENQNEK